MRSRITLLPLDYDVGQALAKDVSSDQGTVSWLSQPPLSRCDESSPSFLFGYTGNLDKEKSNFCLKLRLSDLAAGTRKSSPSLKKRLKRITRNYIQSARDLLFPNKSSWSFLCWDLQYVCLLVLLIFIKFSVRASASRATHKLRHPFCSFVPLHNKQPTKWLNYAQAPTFL